MDKGLPVRKRIRLKDYDYSSAGYYYVTICTKGKRKLFGRVVGTSASGGLLSANWHKVPLSHSESAELVRL